MGRYRKNKKWEDSEKVKMWRYRKNKNGNIKKK